VRLAVLVSGTGSILDAMAQAGLAIEVVLADRPCPALERAQGHGIAAELVERSSFGDDFDRTAYTVEVVEALQHHGIDLVAMAGWGTIFGHPIYDAFGGRVLNTHPSLLPAFPGWHAVADALAYGVKVTGCTVHVATLEVDAGPILAQGCVAVEPDDTVESLHERIKVVERTVYVDTLRTILARGRVQ
jgi:phosphoribosylglycinamide formyltransferase-1